MDCQHGYWLNVEEPFTLCYLGRRCPPQDVERPLDVCGQGWSWLLIGSGVEWSVSLTTNALVSHNGEDPISLCEACQAAWIGLPVYGWSPTTQGYVCVTAICDPPCGLPCDNTMLEPGQGYWVDVEEPGQTLILSPP